MWREEDYTTGFQFEYFPPNDYRGWELERKRWGNNSGSIRETLHPRNDLQELRICIDVDETDPSDPKQHFRGFRILEYDSETYEEIGSPCVDGNWVTYDLKGSRLIGFSVGYTTTDGLTSMSSVCPLQDLGICDNA